MGFVSGWVLGDVRVVGTWMGCGVRRPVVLRCVSGCRQGVRMCGVSAEASEIEGVPLSAEITAGGEEEMVLPLLRQELKAKTKLKKTTTLGELDLGKFGPEETHVNVTIVVKKVRSDFYVRGTVKSKVICVCDRCGKDYEHRGRGNIEIWLATSADGVRLLNAKAENVVFTIDPKISLPKFSHTWSKTRFLLQIGT